jgi:HK97 family phage prohead protease
VDSFETRVQSAKRSIRERSFDGIIRRHAPFTLELRDGAEDGYTISGHAAVFNSLSENLGGFREKIDPGAFASILGKRPDVRALFNHDPNLVLAATRNQSLRLEEDVSGLRYGAIVTAPIAATYYGEAMRAQLSEGLVTQSSFAFRAGDDSWDEDPETGALIRTIHEFSGLYDVSPVTYPAYPATDSGLAGSPPNAERGGDGLDAEERTDDGGDEDGKASEGTWRLNAAKRRMALRA